MIQAHRLASFLFFPQTPAGKICLPEAFVLPEETEETRRQIRTDSLRVMDRPRGGTSTWSSRWTWTHVDLLLCNMSSSHTIVSPLRPEPEAPFGGSTPSELSSGVPLCRTLNGTSFEVRINMELSYFHKSRKDVPSVISNKAQSSLATTVFSPQRRSLNFLSQTFPHLKKKKGKAPQWNVSIDLHTSQRLTARQLLLSSLLKSLKVSSLDKCSSVGCNE